MSTYLVPRPSTILSLFKRDLSDFSILFRVWMSNFRTRRLVKSELPHSGFLAFAQKEKPVVANCLYDSFIAGADEKFFSLKTFRRSWTIMVGNNPRKWDKKTQRFNIRFILSLEKLIPFAFWVKSEIQRMRNWRMRDLIKTASAGQKINVFKIQIYFFLWQDFCSLFIP